MWRDVTGMGITLLDVNHVIELSQAQGAGQRAKTKTRPERRYLRPSERHPPEEAPEIMLGSAL